MFEIFVYTSGDTFYMVFAADQADADAQMKEQVDLEEFEEMSCVPYGLPDAPGVFVLVA